MTSLLSHIRVSPKVFSGYQFVRGLPAGRGGRPHHLSCGRRFFFFFFGFFPRAVKHKFSQDCILDTRRDWGGRRLLLSAMGTGKSWCLQKRSGAMTSIFFQIYSVSRLGYRVDVCDRSTFQWRSLSHRMEHPGRRSPSCETFRSMGTNLKGPESRSSANASSSVILFDTFDRRWLEGSWWIGRSALLTDHAAVPRVVDRRDRWRGFGLFESQGRDYSLVSIVNWNHCERPDYSRTRLERSSLLNFQTCRTLN